MPKPHHDHEAWQREYAQRPRIAELLKGICEKLDVDYASLKLLEIRPGEVVAENITSLVVQPGRPMPVERRVIKVVTW